MYVHRAVARKGVLHGFYNPIPVVTYMILSHTPVAELRVFAYHHDTWKASIPAYDISLEALLRLIYKKQMKNRKLNNSYYMHVVCYTCTVYCVKYRLLYAVYTTHPRRTFFLTCLTSLGYYILQKNYGRFGMGMC